MKTYLKRALSLSLAAGAIVSLSGCIVTPSGHVRVFAPVPPPVYVAPTPPPVYVAPAPAPMPPPPGPEYAGPEMVPDSYVWDGYEYVGFVGGQYYYLGPGHVWLVCEPFRIQRFHGWEHYHHDWRAHAIRNDHYRTDRYGHNHPWHG